MCALSSTRQCTLPVAAAAPAAKPERWRWLQDETRQDKETNAHTQKELELQFHASWWSARRTTTQGWSATKHRRLHTYIHSFIDTCIHTLVLDDGPAFPCDCLSLPFLTVAIIAISLAHPIWTHCVCSFALGDGGRALFARFFFCVLIAVAVLTICFVLFLLLLKAQEAIA